MAEHTHKVVGVKTHRRSGREVYAPGDLITPTQAELAQVPHRFKSLADANKAAKKKAKD